MRSSNRDDAEELQGTCSASEQARKRPVREEEERARAKDGVDDDS